MKVLRHNRINSFIYKVSECSRQAPAAVLSCETFCSVLTTFSILARRNCVITRSGGTNFPSHALILVDI